jgi:hypothetical protein
MVWRKVFDKKQAKKQAKVDLILISGAERAAFNHLI